MTAGSKIVRLSKAAREFNVGITTIVEFLGKKGIDIAPVAGGRTTQTTPETKPKTRQQILAEMAEGRRQDY